MMFDRHPKDKSTFHIIQQFAQANRDVRAEKEKLAQEASIDTLTGLYNQNYWIAETKRLSYKRDKNFTVAFIDLNGLKTFNDTDGHAEGDKRLKTLATLLSKHFRGADILARIGGDEFAVLVETDNPEIVSMMTTRLTKIQREIPLSFGISHSSESLSLSETIQSADRKMYAMKLEQQVNI